MAQLPSGTVTFLFTDIERSTQTVGELGDESYAELQDAHRKLLRTAFAANNGVEVGTEGDAFFVAFARAGDAVTAAIESQRALAEGSQLRVRMGIHTGEALVRDDGYVGHDVHKAKRIQDAGHGGQILLSHTTAELVRDSIHLVDLGLHRLKDLGEPQHVFQVRAEGLESEFPTLRSLDVTPHNLPVQLTSFVGRERELEEISDLLSNHRLVTLMGVGGCGKTRLAIHAAATEAESSPDGIFFCDLSRLADEDALVPSIARALGIELPANENLGSLPMIEAIRNFLSRRETLLVLDNCEHMVTAVADVVEDLLTSSPRLRILATSREALDVAGEQAWPIPSLDATGAAMELFADRAAAVRGGFALNETNAADIRSICERLDGIPLAIELAAAQVGHLGPRQIAERLDQRFLILTGGRRRVQRQQTLQAAMDWSWDLLDDREQTLLRQLSVFQSGCTLEAAEAVCGTTTDVVSGLRSLVGKSLVQPRDAGGVVRYRLLETVRLYAEDKQAASGEGEELRSRHRDYYLTWAEGMPVERIIWGPAFGEDLRVEEDNIRAALRWSEAEGRLDLAARLYCATRRLWFYLQAEAWRWFDTIIGGDLTEELRARVLLSSPGISGPVDPFLERIEEAIGLLGDEPDPWLLQALQARANQSFIRAVATRDESLAERALESVERAQEVGRTLGPLHEAIGLQAKAGVLLMQLRYQDAAEAYVGVMSKWPKDSPASLPRWTVEGLNVLKHILADDWTDEMESSRRAAAGITGRSWTLAYTLDVYSEHGADAAESYIRAETAASQHVAPRIWFSVPLTYMGVIAALRGDWDRAARLLAAAMNVAGIIGSIPSYALYRYWVRKVRAELGAERASVLRDEGRRMSLEEALEYALG